jgi:hypothetical protein
VRWAVTAAVAALAAVVAVNVLLLAYGGDRHDPVGRLSPVANLPARTVKARPLPQPAPVNDHSGRAHGSDD